MDCRAVGGIAERARRVLRLWAVSAVVALSACDAPPPSASPAPGVTAARILAADDEPGNWLTHGRTYDEQRFSPLHQIDTGNVGSLGLAWFLDLDTRRGQEATPLVVDGILYTTTAWSKVYAVDAASGEVIWQYDPQVPPEKGVDACCDVVNRGAAVWQDRVFVGALDGRLIALDAASGAPLWSVQTTPARGRYTITGAPRVVNGKVVIGNAGAEFDVRGFVSAYDADSGDLAWRFYTVPGDPALPFEAAALEAAAATWSGQWWQYGGGGTVWDAMAFDATLNLLYLGVGNGTPWNHKIRSPAGGDNLFLASIVAVNADSGEYVWHYQTTPGDTWDFTATQHMILADLDIQGRTRKVIMQAPKNGFFYVLDRVTGELISAEPFVPVTWATHVDLDTGRPVENPEARYPQGPVEVHPAAPGAHNWHPMSYSPLTGLVYIPTQEIPFVYQDDANFQFREVGINTGTDPLATSMPEDPAVQAEVLATISGYTLAWDPVAQREVWRIPQPIAWNGGALSTAGGLLFQGTGDGRFVAYDAADGRPLWSHDAHTGIVAGPITYAVQGTQYVAVMAGSGGAFAIESGRLAKAAGVRNVSRLLVYRLGGEAQLPAPPPEPPVPAPPPSLASSEVVAQGRLLYHRFCVRCHGDAAVSGGVLPDLRYLSAEVHGQWDAIVLDGARRARAMPGFAGTLDRGAADAIHAYVIKRAHDADFEH